MTKKQALAGQEPRKRRVHTKSRQGCRNCKIRRVKCDETHPRCRKCLEYGVSCNYPAQSQGQGQTPDLLTWQSNEPENNGACQIIFNTNPISKALLPPITVGNGPDSFSLDLESQARLHRFQTQVLPTIGTAKMAALYQEFVIPLSLPHPFLMHTILGVTATHDRLSLAIVSQPITPQESHHQKHAAKTLIKKLSETINPQDRDALWATAALLGIASLASIEPTTPAETWPLKRSTSIPPAPSDPDLQWMNLTKGKEAIWNLTNPLRPDSVFHVLKEEYQILGADPGICELSEIQSEFVHVFNLSNNSRITPNISPTHNSPPNPSHPVHNPYLKAISILTRLRGRECKEGAIPRDLAFIGFMEGSFRGLLQVKDVRALLILAYWYAPLCGSVWFIARRAWLECRAICLYLGIVCEDENVLALLQGPREMCGLD
ncbi:uncharacterized protein N7511_010876 [Penicillium nucicola]|uniref:uncharacterized protein n=1 Tax=Penicillium nucicola TaxID=1850975 RepID=UPI00254578E5|nr:uncharacterized protein N7511_010876 [Penicillium nucicola]KAJ5749180.1 hypothetical protein N7511_010876 [Penicillium nucicola]